MQVILMYINSILTNEELLPYIFLHNIHITININKVMNATTTVLL